MCAMYKFKFSFNIPEQKYKISVNVQLCHFIRSRRVRDGNKKYKRWIEDKSVKVTPNGRLVDYL